MALPQHESESQSTGGSSIDLLLARGNLLLESLAREAHAARLDAKRAELELAMAEATAGNAEQLTRWLEHHGAHYSVHSDAAQSWQASTATNQSTRAVSSAVVGASQVHGASLGLHLPHHKVASEVPSEATAVATVTNSQTVDSTLATANPWQSFLPQARERLLARAAELKIGNRETGPQPSDTVLKPIINDSAPTHSAQPSNEAQPEIAPRKVSNSALTIKPAPIKSDRKTTSNRGAAPRSTDPTTQATRVPRSSVVRTPSSRTSSKRTSSNHSPSSVSRPSAAEIAKQFTQPDPDLVETRYRKIVRILASGMGASMIFHSIVVIALMIVTLKLPQPPASLAFDASAMEPVTETLEISQPAEPSQAVEKSVSEPTPISAAALDASLPSLVDPTLQSMMVQPANSVAKSLTSALASSSNVSGAQAINKASASFFGAAARGNSFCYVVDSSGSMRGGAWEAAKNELMRSLSSLKEKQRFYIIFFAKEFHAIPAVGEREPATYMLYANRENVDHARRWIDTVRIELGAAPNAALEFAISREPDAIYLLTDGDTTVDVCGFLRRVNRTDDLINGERSKVPIHTIAFYSLDGQQLLRQIATENQGQFIYVPDPRAK